MKILHTSDWHLGRLLYGQKRYREFEQFLAWLSETITENSIDILLICGDVFDTTTPSNRAQQLYYHFLSRVAHSCCRHVVIIAGNHDSPSLLNAPKRLLRALNVYVVGAKTDNLEDEVFVLDKDNKPCAIVCAVPYLRDKDIRTVEPGETIDDKNRKLISGLRDHYHEVCKIASEKQHELQTRWRHKLPIIAMGHLFTAGGKTTDDDGVRQLYVGGLAHIHKNHFPQSIDYLALGHLHVPQVVGGVQHIRYCGSPIPMGYGEAKQEKKVLIVDFYGLKPNITELPVPCFQQLIRIKGSLAEIQTRLEQLKEQDSRAWLEIEYTGDYSQSSNLMVIIDDIKAHSNMEVLRIKNNQAIRPLHHSTDQATLDDLKHHDVFHRRLDSLEPKITDAERQQLLACYDEIIQSLNEHDVFAE